MVKAELKEFLIIALSIISFCTFIFFWIWFPINFSYAIESQLQSPQVQSLVRNQFGGTAIILVAEVLIPFLMITLSIMVIYDTLKSGEQ